MAAKQDKLTSAKRFGARYGPRNKIKFDKIERVQRSRQKCPYCNYKNVRRKSVGIWQCSKCTSTFTGRAYEVAAKKTVDVVGRTE
jgi:large subunit ribosomal protein L37Ae